MAYNYKWLQLLRRRRRRRLPIVSKHASQTQRYRSHETVISLLFIILLLVCVRATDSSVTINSVRSNTTSTWKKYVDEEQQRRSLGVRGGRGYEEIGDLEQSATTTTDNDNDDNDNDNDDEDDEDGDGGRMSVQTSKSSKEILILSLKRALGGGLPGAIAGAIQVLSLMWLRTVINYQYRYGSTFLQSLTTLYSSGGIPRLYSGLPFALIQAPLARFVSTAANEGVATLLRHLRSDWGPAREVVLGAIVVGLFRMMLMPIDTCKTVLQIESRRGFDHLMNQVRKGNVAVLYSGALANAMSSFVGHYPWFYTYKVASSSNFIQRCVPWNLGRNALVGFLASIVSDTVSNFTRVIKTTKQALGGTREGGVTYAEAISVILAADGWKGLFGRGLKARIFANALQSIVFTVVWRGLAERWNEHKEKDTDKIVSKEEEEKESAVDATAAESEYETDMDETTEE